MIIAHDYLIEEDQETKAYRVKGKFPAYCPDCRQRLSGYDTRKRTVIGDDGKPVVFLLRRLRCNQCGKLHLEIPDFISPHKHYSAETIKQALQYKWGSCPADDSTIRRWKK